MIQGQGGGAVVVQVPEIPPIPAGAVIAGLDRGDMEAGLSAVRAAWLRSTDSPSLSGSGNAVPSPAARSDSPELFRPADMFHRAEVAMANHGDRASRGSEEELRPDQEEAIEELLSGM